MLQDGVVELSSARLKVAVQVNELQDVWVVLALEIDVPVEHDLPFSERARLVVQRISTLPKSSIADSCLTRTFFFVIRFAPWASVTVMIIGIISGVIPTASATEKRKDSSSGRWKMMFTRRTKEQATSSPK